MIFNTITKEVDSIILESLGDYEVLKVYREGSNRTGVWKIKADGQEYFVKTNSRRSRWAPEVYAYQNWLHKIQPYAPKLIRSFDLGSQVGMIVTSLKGIPLNEAGVTETQLANSFKKVGELTRILHANCQGEWFGRPGVDGECIDAKCYHNPVEYLGDSVQNMLKAGMEKEWYLKEEIVLGEWILAHSKLVQNEVPVATNWDSSPGNWLVDEQGNFVGLIDFENMLWGLGVDNFGMVYERHFIRFPDCKRAYFEGYGMDVFVEKFEVIKVSLIKLGLADIWYGNQIKDERVVNLGRELLKNVQRDEFILP